MLTGIPTSTDFEESGIAYLNLGWDQVIDLLIQLEEAGIAYWDDDGAVQQEYWHSAQRKLSTSLTLTQQGVEFLLKGRIASLSPFLLIAGEPSAWPRGCDKQDIAFSEFRTIDAQDLIRVHDTFAQARLSLQFKEQFERLRKLRNGIIHTINKEFLATPSQIIIDTLIVSKELLPHKKWVDLRKQYLEQSPSSVAFAGIDADYILPREMLAIIEILPHKELLEFFGFNKRQRKYICPRCTYEDGEFYPKLAQLSPNTPTSETLYCFTCNTKFSVFRNNCKSDCKGNVILARDRTCLTCYSRQL